jgi:hypothetical protein
MAEIDVTRPDADELRFQVHVAEGGSTSDHDVTVTAEDLAALGAGYPDPEAFIEACFRFLLAREPKESILGSFDIAVIERYFPWFRAEIASG